MHLHDSRWTLRKPPASCVVCGAVLCAQADASGAYPSCFAVACRMIVSRRAHMNDTAFSHFLRRTVQQQREQRAREAAQQTRQQSEVTENTRTWAALQAYARLAPAGPAAPLHLVLPSGPRRTRPVAPARRARYRAHVTAMVDIAAAMAPGSAAAVTDHAPGPASSLPGQLCGTCGGGCCTRGSNHAYLSPDTLRRFMDAQPPLSHAEVVAAYVDRVTATSQAGSCINHTSGGCSLPRDMRSDICNAFACAALAQLQGAQAERQEVQVVLVVRRKQDQWQRDRADLDNPVTGATVLRETGARRMPLR